MTSQGLASGDVNRDAQPLRFMIHEGVPVVLVQSFDTVSRFQLSCSISIADTTDDGYLHRQSFDRLGGGQEHGRESKSQFSTPNNSQRDVSTSITVGRACRTCHPVQPEIVYRLVSHVLLSWSTTDGQVERDQGYGGSTTECTGQIV